ncbi:TPA: hypothetical protein MIR16_28325, partial [Klebsiella pneumoniae]|nr:hypothetical protein [Klebsiella pneumoniae]
LAEISFISLQGQKDTIWLFKKRQVSHIPTLEASGLVKKACLSAGSIEFGIQGGSIITHLHC